MTKNDTAALNESPSEKEGKYQCHDGSSFFLSALNESPSEKEGKFLRTVFLSNALVFPLNESPSEKEGKLKHLYGLVRLAEPLNESPSEKEGKCWTWRADSPAMKCPQ